jgi:hypothetical protein
LERLGIIVAGLQPLDAFNCTINLAGIVFNGGGIGFSRALYGSPMPPPEHVSILMGG